MAPAISAVRDKAIERLTSLGISLDFLQGLDNGKLYSLVKAVADHTHDGQHWLQAHKDVLRRVDVDESGMVLFYLKCKNCSGIAIFTAEGPNDEYPEPLCERCEGGDPAE